MSGYPEVSTAVSMVYFYGTRRFLTKRAAFAAKALDMMRGDQHWSGYYDTETGASESCDCFACRDCGFERTGPAHKAITRALMRGEPIPAEYVKELRAASERREERR